jgi:hypothetical protein
MRWLRSAAAVAAAFALLHLAVILLIRPAPNDLPSTYFYPRAHAIASGTAPYDRTLPLGRYEYPPATIPLLQAPLLAGGDAPVAYQRRTIWLYGILDLAVVGVLAGVLRRDARSLAFALAVYTASVLVLGRLAFTRFDLAVGLALLGAGLLGRRGPVWAAALVGLAGALKAAPIAALGALLEQRTWVRVIAAGLAVPILAQLVYLAAYGDPGLSWISQQTGRGTQVESWAAVLADLGRAGGAHVTHAYQQTTDNLHGMLADALAHLFELAAIAWVPLSSMWVAQRRLTGAPEAILLVLGGLVVLSPVLSPQYLLWLAPLVALVAPRTPAAAVLFALSCAATRLEISVGYDGLRSFHTGSIALVALRNTLLVLWLLAAVAAASARAARTPRLPVSRVP